MRAKLFVALCGIWGTIIVGIGVNLVSSYIQDSFISFLIHYRVWVAAGFVSITGLTLWSWKAYRFAEAHTYFTLLKEAKDLTPEDFGFKRFKHGEMAIDPAARPYYETYIPRRIVSYEVPAKAKEDEQIIYEEPVLAGFLQAGQGIVLIGPSREGKTRTLFEIIRELTTSTVDSPLPKQTLWTKFCTPWPDSGGYTLVQPTLSRELPPEKVFSIFKGRRVIVLLNDFHHYVRQAPNLGEFCTAIEGKNKDNAVSWVVAATCRDGNELREVQRATGTEGRFFQEKIRHKLQTVPAEEHEQRRLQAVTGKPWNGPYATLGDTVLKGIDDAMKARFTTLEPQHQEVLRAFKLCYTAGIRPYTTERLDAVLHHIFKRPDWVQSRDSLQPLAEQSFLKRLTLPATIDPEPYYLANIVSYERHDDDPTGDFPLLMDTLEASKDADGLYALARTFFDNEDKTNARACFEKVANLRPDFLRDQVDEAYAKDRYAEAVEAYDYWLLLHLDDASAWYNKGLCLHHMGRYEEALVAYTQTTILQPDDAKAWTGKGSCLGNMRRYEEALAAYDWATTLQPDDASAWDNKGLCLTRMRRYEEALTAYDRATTLQPDSVRAWVNKGAFLHNEMGRYAEALAATDQALKLQPDDATAWANKGNHLRFMGRYEEALAAYDRATTLQPDYVNAWANKGFCLQDMGRHKEALAAYGRATTLQPNDASAWANKGLCLTRMRRYEEALTAYDRATTLQPDHANAWANKGFCLQDMGRHKEALAAYDRATTLQPDHANAWANKGFCLQDMGRHKEALAACQRVMDLQPKDARLWRGIAHTAEACRDRIMAEKAVLRALELERKQEEKK